MNPYRNTLIFACLFASACAVALLAVFRTSRHAPAVGVSPSEPVPMRVVWRVALGVRAVPPCACADGWAVADSAGGVAMVTQDGHVRWRVAFSNEAFSGGCEIAGGLVAVASESGRVFGLERATGATRWIRETDARFQHAPLTGLRGKALVLWLVSQEDGRLFCLRASDGSVVWCTDGTNRCDGTPAVWPGRIAYGNCDGAVYVFDSFDGKLLGKVEVGAEDQMAGGILVLKDGSLVTGTRSGRLVLVNPETLTCGASAKVSDSEAFVTPVACFMDLLAMGSDEGDVTLWRHSDKTLNQVSRFATGAAITCLAWGKDRVFALAGGSLVAFSQDKEIGRIALGDDVGGLVVNASGDAVCVADGALVCAKGGGT